MDGVFLYGVVLISVRDHSEKRVSELLITTIAEAKPVTNSCSVIEALFLRPPRAVTTQQSNQQVVVINWRDATAFVISSAYQKNYVLILMRALS